MHHETGHFKIGHPDTGASPRRTTPQQTLAARLMTLADDTHRIGLHADAQAIAALAEAMLGGASDRLATH